MSMPGTGFVSATAILAEIGNYIDLKGRTACRMLWPCSFFISVSRKDYPRGITKQASKHIRRMLI
jgi:transposase